MSDYSTWKTEYPHSTDEPYYDDCKDDEWLSVKDLEDFGLNMDMNHVMPMKEHLHKDIKDGALAHGIIVCFHDWFFNMRHPNPPIDAMSSTRSNTPVFVQNESNVHPSAVDASFFLRSGNEVERNQQYCQQINITERHKCNAYCTRKNKERILEDGKVSYCRFNFPYDVSSNTHVKVIQYVVGSMSGRKKVKGKRGKKQGTPTLKYRLELVRRTNDRHLNSHWRSINELALGWYFSGLCSTLKF